VLRFLSVQNVLDLHRATIQRHGGPHGIRDIRLLDAAVAMPMQRLDGRYLHDGIPAMAAAYLFHIAANHPFIDGSKRVATAACLVFLVTNGADLAVPDALLTDTVMRVASGELDKPGLTAWLRKHCTLRRDK